MYVPNGEKTLRTIVHELADLTGLLRYEFCSLWTLVLICTAVFGGFPTLATYAVISIAMTMIVLRWTGLRFRPPAAVRRTPPMMRKVRSSA